MRTAKKATKKNSASKNYVRVRTTNNHVFELRRNKMVVVSPKIFTEKGNERSVEKSEIRRALASSDAYINTTDWGRSDSYYAGMDSFGAGQFQVGPEWFTKSGTKAIQEWANGSAAKNRKNKSSRRAK